MTLPRRFGGVRAQYIEGAALRPRRCEGRRGLALGRGRECVAEIDEVVGDDAEADPTLHAIGALVTTSVQPMTSLQEADPTLAPGSPFLGTAEPALLLQLLALGGLGTEVGNCDALDATLTRGRFVACREEARVGGDQTGRCPNCCS